MMRKGTIAFVAAALVFAAPSDAATYKTTRLDDPVPGNCKPKDCSLREAISASNETDAVDTVKLRKGRYEMELADDATDDNENGDLDVLDEMKIVGPGAKRTVVDMNGIDRVFTFLGFSKHSLKGVTVTGGAALSGAGVFVGPSPLKLQGVVIKSNTATQSGGGLRSVSPKLTIAKSTVAGNESPLGGGISLPTGFVAVPNAKITASTISGNESADGAGLHTDGTNSGGADDEPFVTVVNSTIASNEATGNGGGIAATNGATISIDNSSIAFNTANADGTGMGSGGGLIQATGATFSVDDSVVAGNEAIGSDGPQCFGTFPGDANVSTLDSDCDLFGSSTSQPIVSGQLKNYGGPTKTIKLATDSAAIGRAASCPGRDQRGKRRPANCDSGSFENKPKR